MSKSKGGSVLIIERDASIRTMMTVVLRRQGFSVRAVPDAGAADTLTERIRVDAVLRDVSAASELAATAPAILRRTIVMTTQARLQQAAAFAVILKPFDFEELVRVTAACVRQSRDERGIDLGSLRHFVASVPDLRRELASGTGSMGELLLVSEMRRTILELSAALHAAAEVQPSRTRAAAFLAASAVAADLAQRTAAGSIPAPVRGDH